MTKIKPLPNSKVGGSNNPLPISKITSSIPPVEQYGFPHGGNSASQEALNRQLATNNKQSALNNMHSGGGSNLNPQSLNSETENQVIEVPQASTHGMPKIGPNNGNSNATTATKTLTQSVANAQFDNKVGENPTQTIKTGGRKSRKKRRYKRRKTNKRRKLNKSSRKKRTKHRRKHKKTKSRRR